MRNMIPVFYIIRRKFKRPYFWACIAVSVLALALAARAGHVKQNETRRIPIAVVDEDGTEISALVVERIKNNDFVEVKTFNKPMDALMRWEVDGFFVLKEGFMEKLLNGEKKELIDFYYPPVYVTPEIIGEVVTKEVMRIYVSYKASDFIRGEYEKRGMSFDEALKKETIAYTDNFWDIGDTITLDVKYLSEGNSLANDNSTLKTFTINAVLAVVLMFITMISGVGLVTQSENDVFTRLKLCNVSHITYAAASAVTPAAVCLPALLFIPLTGKAAFALFILWCGLFTIFMACVVKRVNSYLLLQAVLPLLLTGVAGLSIFIGGNAVFLGILNPVYCVMTADAGFMALHVLSAVCVLGILNASK